MTLSSDSILMIGGFLVSLFGFSLIFGDNWLFQLAVSLLTGALSGLLILILTNSVFIPYAIMPLADGELGGSTQLMILFVLLAAILLLLRNFTRSRAGGSLVLAIVLTISVALTILGIVNGTLLQLYKGILSQLLAAKEGNATRMQWVQVVFLFAGAISALFYTRHYAFSKGNNPRQGKRGWIRSFGDIFVGITLGAIFAGTLIASATILVDHMTTLLEDGRVILDLLGPK